ncbi:MAG TPA: LysR substrate-binding domain-containing protein [Vineibacter sp.]|nr:LysR substrate-binding domain-containing protein [Vineibacter sp.]
MELRHIRYFAAVAEEGSISAASTRVRIAQSALSARIANLEAELGAKLFARHGRGTTLTPAGRLFHKHAQRILSAVDAARHAIRATTGTSTGEVVLGLPSTIAMLLTVPIIELVRERLPHVELRIVDGMNGDIQAWLAEGRLDVAIIYLTGRRGDRHTIPLVDDDLYLIGKETPQTRGRKQIAFAELASLPLVHTSVAHAGRILLDRVAHRTGVTLCYATEVDSLAQLKTLVQRGHGHTVLPMIALGDSRSDPRIRTLRIVEPDLKLRCSLAFTPRRKVSRAVRDAAALVPVVAERLLRQRRWHGGRRAEPDAGR